MFLGYFRQKRKVQFPKFQFCTKDKNVNLIQETQTKAKPRYGRLLNVKFESKDAFCNNNGLF